MKHPQNILVDVEQRQMKRLWWVSCAMTVFISLLLLGVIARVAYLRAMPDERITSRISQRIASTPMHGRRGTITDRNGRVFAITRVGYSLFVDPREIEDFSTFAAHLGHAMGVDPSSIDMQIMKRLERFPNSRYVKIEKLLNEQQHQAVLKIRKDLKLRGIGFESRLVREYPAGNLAGQVVGFVGHDHMGLDGVEYALNNQLAGKAGQLQYIGDPRRRAVWVNQGDYQSPVNGADVQLSIDMVVQEIAQKALLATTEQYSPKAAEVIVMHARTGQILAMVNWPYYDPNQGGNVTAASRRNRSLTDPYEPGSIFKPYVHALITEAGVYRANQKIKTENGAWRTSFGRTLHDAHGYPELTWDMVLIKSSNIGMGKAGLKLGKKRMYEGVRRFGFGQITGCGLPGESAGIVNAFRRWNKYSITSVPMGQEVAVTPIQMAKAFSAFANEGMVVSPSIFAEDTNQPILQYALDARTANHTQQVLRRVVVEGTGKKAKSDLYTIWGKTGTAQVADPRTKRYKTRAYTGSFVCGAPLVNPQIIVAVVIHEPDPDKGYYGGIVAGPVAKEIVEKTLLYLGIPNDIPQDTIDDIEVALH